MEDRTMLELAAKAAGYARMKYFDDTPYVSVDMNGDDFLAWNPLTDDGDAFRLSHKLGFTTEHARGYVACYSGSVCADQFTERYGNDLYAATRRAITRAAAEIGKAKREG